MKLKYDWKTITTYKDILFQQYNGIARISINRPSVRNAFTPLTVKEMIDAMNYCREDANIGVIILTGEGGEAAATKACEDTAGTSVRTQCRDSTCSTFKSLSAQSPNQSLPL